MKKIKTLLISCIVMFLLLIFSPNEVSANSYLHLNHLEFYIKVNQDASINVTEYWDIEIEETNTLYKSFKVDNTKYTGITDVRVTDITDGKNELFTMQKNWQYHVDKGKYYGTKNQEGNFEIGWGVGLEDSWGENRKYKIEYKVQNAVTKYKDYSELYWQLLGKDFEINANNVTGTIILPANAKSKEDIKVWGHIETLNGTIYATDLNKIEFQVDGYNWGNMLEIRTLFPTEMIKSASRNYDTEILQTVIDEETKWVKEANQKRFVKELIYILIILVLGLILDIVFIKSIIKANKNPIKRQKKIMPEQIMEYYRDIPRENASPGEAINLLQKNATSCIIYNSFGQIISADLLNLKLKGFIEFEIDESKNINEKISIIIKEAGNIEKLLEEEKDIYNFLREIVSKKEEKVLTLKQLQDSIKSNPNKIARLNKNIGKSIYSSLCDNKLVNDKQAKERDKILGITAIQVAFFLIYLLFSSILSTELGVVSGILSKIIRMSTSILVIISIIQTSNILRKINKFTQKGVNEIEQWVGLKKYMEDFSLLNEREVPDIVIWERFLVYATVFGIADKVIKQLKMVYPNFDQLPMNDHAMMYLMLNTDFNNSFSSAVSTTMSSTYSSATGGGGGFSGGGGGGGGRRWWRRTLKNKI